MAEISAAMVKELRDKTGAGMMDCKAALAATEGDIEGAVDWLRKKGLAKAAKKSGRVAAEGLIGIWAEGSKAAMVEVNSETDFVARNDMFQGLVRMIAHVAFKLDTNDMEAIKAASAGSGTIADAVSSAVATIGENMTLRRAAGLKVGQGVVASYSHAAVAENLGKIGVLVGLESSGKTDELATIGRQIAMHVAAQNPLAIDASGLDAALIEREKGVLRDKNAGKPPQVLDKIVESGLKTFYKEVCLLEQPFVIDPSKSVAQALKEAEGRVGAPIALKSFVRYALGEGIEREESDFAAEVAAAAGTR